MTGWAGVDHSQACTGLGLPWVSRVGGWGWGLGGNGGEGGQTVMHWPFCVCHASNHNNLGRGMAASRHLQSLMRIALSTTSNPGLSQERDLGESSSSLAKMTPYKPPHSSISSPCSHSPQCLRNGFYIWFLQIGVQTRSTYCICYVFLNLELFPLPLFSMTFICWRAWVVGISAEIPYIAHLAHSVLLA